jgi:exodeoxyribonuclease V gamma subunit
VLVAELLDSLIPAIATDPTSASSREDARRRLVLEHPLQPFSPRYFAADADPRLRSFNQELCEALRRGRTDTALPELEAEEGTEEEEEEERVREPAGRFFTAPLAAPGAEWREVTLERLIRFFVNPCAYLLRERLGIELARADAELAEEEPFLPDYPARQALAERLSAPLQAGLGQDELRTLAQAGIEYPPGGFGLQLLDQELATLRDFARRCADATRESCLPPQSHTLEFDLDGEAWRLTGAFADLRPRGLVRSRYDDARPRDYLEAWLQHLWLCSLPGATTARETLWIARDGEFLLRPCETASEFLQTLLRLYRQGLQEPLHFFPKTAWKYCEQGENLRQARTAWESSQEAARGEGNHAEIGRASCRERVS